MVIAAALKRFGQVANGIRQHCTPPSSSMLVQTCNGLRTRFYATKNFTDDSDDDREVVTFKKSRKQEPLPKTKWNFDMTVVDVNRTFKVTKAGGIQSFTALVVCGNYEGIAGFGKGKAADVSYAVDKAYRRSLKNLHFFDIYRNRTIYHNQQSKFCRSRVNLVPARRGKGIVSASFLRDVFYLAGYKDLSCKIIGSTHPHNTIKAVFKALCSIETPEATTVEKTTKDHSLIH